MQRQDAGPAAALIHLNPSLLRGIPMTNRREFLQRCMATGGVLAAAPLFAVELFPTQSVNSLAPSRAIYDAGFAEARAFARAARDSGMTTDAFSGDVTRLWYDDLYFKWRDGSVVITGMTGASALFCLEKLAWDASHRVLHRLDHKQTAAARAVQPWSEPLVSWVIAPRSLA